MIPLFPQLIPRSEDLEWIPEPEDFGLDTLVDNIIASDRIGHVSDFIEDERSEVQAYMEDLVFHPETDTAVIESRQQLLTAFMDSPDIMDHVLKATIRHEPQWSHDFPVDNISNYTDRARGFVNYLAGLVEHLPKTQNFDLERFRNTINRVNSDERIQKLNDIVRDIDMPGILEIDTEFVVNTGYFNDGSYRYECESKLSATFASGERHSGMVDKEYGGRRSKTELPYHDMIRVAIDQVKKHTGKHLVNSEKEAKLQVRIDESTGKITGTVSYDVLDPWKSFLSLKKKKRTIETPLDFDQEIDKDIVKDYYGFEEITVDRFTTAMDIIKNKEFSDEIRSYDAAIRSFIQPVTELRALALAANYFKNIEESDVPTVIPEIRPAHERLTHIKNLYEPDLIQHARHEIVANTVDADAERNLFTLTGPNNNGKTTYMNAIGIAQAMFQAGFKVVAEDAIMSPRDNIFSHYIRPGDIVVGESRFAHELSRIREIFQHATGNSLVLLDESYSGTAPADAQQLIDDMFRTIGDLGATTYIATHFHSLADTAKELPFAGNLYCVAEENGQDLTYTYRIVEGSSQKSNGIYLARKMGADRTGLRSVLEERVENEGLVLR